MSAIIVPFSTAQTPQIITGMREIFFETSNKKEFKNEEDREQFFLKYLGFYLKFYPQFAWIALEKNKVLGYVVSMPKSQDPDIYALQPHMPIFEEFFNTYPSHLHINLHQDARGMGLGSKLLKECEKALQAAKITGLHIMTGPGSRNINFYKKLGFTFEVELNFHGSPILFMGKSLGD